MKYSIDGIEKSKIIKSTQVINKKDSGKAIIVNYLDGTQDVFELNDENLNRIIEIAEDQGENFSKQKTKRSKKIESFSWVSTSMFLLTSLVNILIFALVKQFATYGLISGIIWGILTIVSSTLLYKNEQYKKKYQLYFEKVKAKLEDYQEILEREKQLTKSKNKNNVKLDNVLDLDKVSLKQVQKIDEKVDRYQEVEKQKVKKKENSSLY